MTNNIWVIIFVCDIALAIVVCCLLVLIWQGMGLPKQKKRQLTAKFPSVK